MSSRPTKARRKPAPPVPQAVVTEAQLAGELTPLAYMLAVVRDPNADPARRDRMAICAAQYCHAKPNEPGKKEAEAKAAERAGVATEWASDLDVDAQPRQ